ncbi:hypothetical protein V1478_016686 [Vespula squamosa]|uniref:Uncharacterized protein n=1 Tax=Vespula squamosa TaxID=30214 RepID=A0ABD2A0J4_VESSQ
MIVDISETKFLPLRRHYLSVQCQSVNEAWLDDVPYCEEEKEEEHVMIDVTAAKRKEKRKKYMCEPVGEGEWRWRIIPIAAVGRTHRGRLVTFRMIILSKNICLHHQRGKIHLKRERISLEDARHGRGLFSQGRIESR